MFKMHPVNMFHNFYERERGVFVGITGQEILTQWHVYYALCDPISQQCVAFFFESKYILT
jgi:hypothetical protein